MKTKFKVLILACLAVCLAMCVALIAACGGDEKEPVRLSDTFTVTVVYSDGEAVPTSLKVNFYDAPDVEDGAVLGGFRVDENGTVSESVAELKGNKVMIVLKSRPAGYEYYDANGNAYAKEEGVIFDLTKVSSGTVTLTKIAE